MHLILHIGTEKTGTTVLQRWLKENKRVLSDLGVFLRESGYSANNRKLVHYVQNTMAEEWFYTRRITTQEEKDAYFEGYEAQFAEQVQAARQTHDYMLISSEQFQSRLRTKEEMARIHKLLTKHFDQISLVCYFREQSQMRRSLYSTALKESCVDPVSEFRKGIGPQDLYFNHYETAKRWSAFFGQENCIFRIYDKGQFDGGDLRLDFLASLPVDLPVDAFSFETVKSNSSLSLLEAELFRVINTQTSEWAVKGVRKKKQILKEAIRKAPQVKHGKVETQSDLEIYQKFEASNRAFFDEFIGGDQSFPRPVPASQDTSEPRYSLDDVTDITSNLLDQLLKLRMFKVQAVEPHESDLLNRVSSRLSRAEPISDDDVRELSELSGRFKEN